MLPTFRYATISEIKARISDEILTEANITDGEILERIEAASSMINDWTRQHFQPTPEAVRVSARGDKLLTHPRRLPFLSLKQISIIDNRTTGQFKGVSRVIPDAQRCRDNIYGSVGGAAYATSNYPYIFTIDDNYPQVGWEPGNRTIEMIVLCGGFTKGFKNVEMQGWWGWLEALKSFSTTLIDAIPANSADITTVKVDDAVDPDTGDFLSVGDTIAIVVKDSTQGLVPDVVELAIVQAIAEDTGDYDITVDGLHSYPVEIPVGAKVYSFGKIPAGLDEVAQYLAAVLVKNLSAERQNDPVAGAIADGNLKSERTDNYSYTLSSGGGTGGGGAGNLGKYTGSVRMDLVLRKFVQPTVSVRLI